MIDILSYFGAKSGGDEPAAEDQSLIRPNSRLDNVAGGSSPDIPEKSDGPLATMEVKSQGYNGGDDLKLPNMSAKEIASYLYYAILIIALIFVVNEACNPEHSIVAKVKSSFLSSS